MDYFVISSDYPELVKAVQEIFTNNENVNVISGKSSKLDLKSDLVLDLVTEGFILDL